MSSKKSVKTIGVALDEAREEVKRLRGCILGLYKELGKKHKNVCFDPDCDGSCFLEKHPYERWVEPK